jgi:hypothetical protein
MPKKKKEKSRVTIVDDDSQELVKLGPDDVAIVIRKNLDMELFIPNREDDAVVQDAEMHGFAVMMALSDPALSQQMLDMAEQKMSEAEAETEKQDEKKETKNLN